jgi:hypothetical protein
VDHPLLVPAEIEGEAVARLLQGLADSAHVAVAEDPEDAWDEPPLDAVALGVLLGEELDEGLGHGEPSRLHRRSPRTDVMGTRGSGFVRVQASRTQW